MNSISSRIRFWLESAWAAPPGRAPRGTWILDALAALYGAGRRVRTSRPKRAAIAIISVGSLRVGGAGKTPLAGEVARLARAEGLVPAILLRGYGGRTHRGVWRVPEGPGGTRAALYGDEACLHAHEGHAAVYVARRRLAAAAQAQTDGCDIAILDDGMQHRPIHRELEIVALPAERPFGNDRLLPRGPLREPASELKRAHLIVLAHAAPSPVPSETLAILRRLAPDTPVFSWRGEITVRPLFGDPPPAGSDVALLSGIADPGRFRRTVEEAGFRVAWVASFRDHHPFRQREIEEVRKRAIRDSIGWIVTTAKDEVRLADLRLGDRPFFCCADLRLTWNEPKAEQALRRMLRQIVWMKRIRPVTSW